MRRFAWTILLVTTASCAGHTATPEVTSGTAAAATTTQSASSGIGVNMGVQTASSASRVTIASPVAMVWDALNKAYASIPIAPSERNASTYALGNSSFKVRRKLGDMQMMKVLDCGGDNSSPNAETYEITLSVRSQLSAAPGGGTLLQTIVEGVGKNVLTNSANQVPCYSTGGIETRIADLVSSALGLTMPVVKKPK